MTLDTWTQRTGLLLGDGALDRLQKAHVLIVGVGGVGSYAAEALARAGVGEISLVDADTVDDTNRNRQIPALVSTVGESKVRVMGERLLAVNPKLRLHTWPVFLDEKTLPDILAVRYDYIVDAIDSLSPKAFLIANALQKQIPLIVSLGSAGKLDPTLISYKNLNQTHDCPLARALRQRLKGLDVSLSQVECVFSSEKSSGGCPALPDGQSDTLGKRSHRGTVSYLPAIFGLYAAAAVIRRIANPDRA